MSLTDDTYYVLDRNIPTSDYNDLAAYRTRYEKLIIMDLFGFKLGTLVLAYTASSPQRIKDIVEGKEYDLSDGTTIKWNGLLNEDKISLLSDYVYHWFLKNNNTTLQGIGNRKLKGENSDSARVGIKMSTAWSQLEDLYGSSCQNNDEPSCYNFLTAHESVYPEWVFKEIGNVNNYDL